ncbi:MAG: ferredoxin [Acidimicrobiia bacterium]
MRIVHDAAKCTGHGRCYVLGPSLFEDDDRGYGVVIGDGTLGADQMALAEGMVAACPEGAISIVE